MWYKPIFQSAWEKYKSLRKVKKVYKANKVKNSRYKKIMSSWVWSNRRSIWPSFRFKETFTKKWFKPISWLKKWIRRAWINMKISNIKKNNISNIKKNTWFLAKVYQWKTWKRLYPVKKI